MKKLLFALAVLVALTDIQAQSIDFSKFEYRHVGPYRGGRSTTVTGVADRPNEFYMGTTGGGLWKTTDYGTTWKNVSDGFFSTPSIGSVTVAPSNSDIVYVGTGSDGLRSNVITGRGMYKSMDGGKKWRHIGLDKTGHIGAVEVNPGNQNIVFVAAIGQAFSANEERGVYRTTDGGLTWEQVLAISDTTGFADLEFAPDDPNTIYAAAWRAERKPWTIISGGDENGIYRSVDGGDNWTRIDNGLPVLKGKIDLAVSANNPDVLYALVEARDTLSGLYRSDDRGESFRHVSHKQELTDRGFYYTNVHADPQNVDKVYVMSTRFYRSNNAGEKWTQLRVPHGDNHDIWINPNDSSLMIQANDGGANVSFNGGKTWTHQYGQPTAEIYQVEVDNQYPYWLYGGQQDNYSTISVPSMPPSSSQVGAIGFIVDAGGCETGPAVPNPENPDIVYANCKGRFSVYNKRTGQEQSYNVEGYFMYGHNTRDLPQRFQRVAPIHVSPHDPSVIYHCSQHVFKTTNEGQNWQQISPDLTAFEPDKQMRSGGPITNDITGEEFYSTIYAIRESPVTPGLIWVGANDGPVHVTLDGGRNWQDVTPSDLDPGGRVDCVEPSPHSASKAYIAVLRYQLGDWSPYIYKTNNNGESWDLITKGIPSEYPVRVIREDPVQEGLLYAGTEFGMFISFDDGANWQSFQQNLPVTPITDIKIHRNDVVLSTMGRGFWIADNVSPLRNGFVNVEETTLFTPNPTIRLRSRNFSSMGNPAPSPRYPVPGVLVDYYLQDSVDQLKLEILDKSGEVIRSYSSRDSAIEKSESDMVTSTTQTIFTDDLKVSAGHHRFRWNMRHAGAWDAKRSRAYTRGPMAAPGNYAVRITVGDAQYEQPFVLKRDPRVLYSDVSDEDLLEQERFALQVVELHSLAKKKAHRLKEKLKEEEDEEVRNALKEACDFLVQAKGRYTQPKFIAQVNYLYGQVNRADQRPGMDVYKRYNQLVEEYNAFLDNLSATD